MTPTTWVLDGVTFYGYDAGVDKFLVSSMVGVNDAPSVRTESLPRPLSHGDFPLPTTRAPRLITAAGWCETTDEAGLLTLRNQLMGILEDGSTGDFVINEFDVSRTVKDAEIYGDTTFSRRGEFLRADWSFMLRAVDPRLYDDGIGDGHW